MSGRPFVIGIQHFCAIVLKENNISGPTVFSVVFFVLVLDPSNSYWSRAGYIFIYFFFIIIIIIITGSWYFFPRHYYFAFVTRLVKLGDHDDNDYCVQHSVHHHHLYYTRTGSARGA